MGGDQRHMMEGAAEDKIPEGLRVLAVDDDCICLKVLENLLRGCKYHPTTVPDAKTALKILRAGKEVFDLVITDVRMQDMDGFKLLERIRLEMDLPVIMLSADCDKKAVMKGISHGACDYLVKPGHTNELKNIWQHVESKRSSEAIRHISGDDDDDQRAQLGTAAKSNDVANTDENKESTQTSTTQKKPRMGWTIELHTKFMEAINQIGLYRATPKKILELMNVDYLTRQNVSSHLQKYKLYLKRINPNPLGDACVRWNSFMNIQESSMHNHEYERWGVSSGAIASWSPNNYDEAGHLGQHTNTQSSMSMGSLINGGRMPVYLLPQTPYMERFSGFNEHIVPFIIPGNASSIGMLNANNSVPMAPPQFVYSDPITTLVAGFSEQMEPFNIESNMGSVGMMLNGKSTPGTGRTSVAETDMVHYGRTSSTLSNHQTDGLVPLTQMHDVSDASGTLHVQEGTMGQQALSGQLNGINALSSGGISNLLTEDFIGEDAVMDG
ncbi:two-component response regulator ARR12-like [Triticum aestivum]|uniref:two-component response regulator ARR12-like n=1 Tax=Triticum aestivum TaxID=4565 RepID=UPI001D018D92|nr:two-component response regulator ARR12-like [Triticum aestivum]